LEIIPSEKGWSGSGGGIAPSETADRLSENAPPHRRAPPGGQSPTFLSMRGSRQWCTIYGQTTIRNCRAMGRGSAGRECQRHAGGYGCRCRIRAARCRALQHDGPSQGSAEIVQRVALAVPRFITTGSKGWPRPEGTTWSPGSARPAADNCCPHLLDIQGSRTRGSAQRPASAVATQLKRVVVDVLDGSGHIASADQSRWYTLIWCDQSVPRTPSLNGRDVQAVNGVATFSNLSHSIGRQLRPHAATALLPAEHSRCLNRGRIPRRKLVAAIPRHRVVARDLRSGRHVHVEDQFGSRMGRQLDPHPVNIYPGRSVRDRGPLTAAANNGSRRFQRRPVARGHIKLRAPTAH